MTAYKNEFSKCAISDIYCFYTQLNVIFYENTICLHKYFCRMLNNTYISHLYSISQLQLIILTTRHVNILRYCTENVVFPYYSTALKLFKLSEPKIHISASFTLLSPKNPYQFRIVLLDDEASLFFPAWVQILRKTEFLFFSF